MTAVYGHTRSIVPNMAHHTADPPHGKDVPPDGSGTPPAACPLPVRSLTPRRTAIPRSPHTRPSFPHRSSASASASIDSTVSSSPASAAGHPLSPPLPPARFNPAPDIHPLIRAAAMTTSRTEPDGDDVHPVISPITDPDGYPCTSGLGPSVTSTTTTTTTYFPPRTTTPASTFECVDEVGLIQRRLSEGRRRRRRRSGISMPRGSSEDATSDARMEDDGYAVERSGDDVEGGTGHLRGAREELKAVLEEAIAQMPTCHELHADDAARHVQDTDPSIIAKESAIVGDPSNAKGSAIADALQPSPHLSPALSPATPAFHAPTSFEDTVRHQRHGSVGQSPAHSSTGAVPAGSAGSRRTSVTKASPTSRSPASSRRASAVELTKMRRAFSREQGRATAGVPSGQERTVVAPASILQFLGRSDDAPITAAEQHPRETGLEQVERGLSDLDLNGQRSSEPEQADAGAHLDATLHPRTALDPLPATQPNQLNPPSSPPSDSHIADTHLWDSVWPSSTSPTHFLEPRGVSYPKPMSDPRGALRPRLPMHSRTSSMSIHSFSESSASSSSPYASPHTAGPMHSLGFGFPRQLSRPHEPPSPAAPAAYPRTGIPLFFSEALTTTTTSAPAWAQHPSARRGSLASLGTWPLKRDNSLGVGAGGEGNAVEKPHTIHEGDGADGKGLGDQAATISQETGGNNADNTRQIEA